MALLRLPGSTANAAVFSAVGWPTRRPVATNILVWKAILGERGSGPDVSDYAAPARADDRAGIPATLIIVGELDVFRDEDLAIAIRLVACGVPTEFHLYPRADHAWDLFVPEVRLTKSFLAVWHDYRRRKFA